MTQKTFLKKTEHGLEQTIFRSRWLLAPFYIGLVLSIFVLLITFFKKLMYLFANVWLLSDAQVIVYILALIDIALVGSLLLMIIFSGYEIFVSKIDVADHEDRPAWMGKLEFSGLKLKVIGAIVAISAIDLLKSFMNIDEPLAQDDSSMLLWKVLIHMTFVISGVLFALMDYIAANTKSH